MSGELWQIGPLQVEPEQSLRGVFEVDVGLTHINFPIALINGQEPDPVLLVTAGIDGDEPSACEAALRLIDALNPAELRGRIMVCPVLDPLSFEALHSQNPLDGLFLRTVLPGNLKGKPTQRLAYFIFHNFITHADAWIDLHSAKPNERAIPFTWTMQGKDLLVNEQNRILVNQSGADVGLLRAPFAWEPIDTAMRAGTALLVSQAGHRNYVEEEAVEAHLKVIQSILDGMDLLPHSTPPHQPQVYLDHEPVRSEHSGLWYPAITPGDMVKAGQVVGEVFKLDGSELLQQVKSPVDGIVLSMHAGLASRARLRLALIGHRPQQI